MDTLACLVERLLQAVLFVAVMGLVICLVKLQWLAAIGFLALGAGVLLIFFHVRCPRCAEPAGAELVGNRHWGRDQDKGEPLAAGECPGCGRSRDGVLPFQYLLAPERDAGEAS